MAAPQAAGVGALLVSAAKQAGAQHSRTRSGRRCSRRARYLTEGNRFQALDQGNGLMNIQGAWNLLRQNLKTVTITSAVPVNTILSGFLATPGVGQGIYDREGVDRRPVVHADVHVHAARRAGRLDHLQRRLGRKRRDVLVGRHRSRWARARSATLPVTVNPSTAGYHSAILTLTTRRRRASSTRR